MAEYKSEQDVVRGMGLRYAQVLYVLLRRANVGRGEMATLRRGGRHVSVPVRLGDPVSGYRKALSITRALAHATGVDHVVVEENSGWLVYQFELPEWLWEVYTRADLERRKRVATVGVGLRERRAQVDINFDRVMHLAILGSSQTSGKSTALHSLMCGLMEAHTPEELRVYVVDPAGDALRGMEKAPHLLLPPARTPRQAAYVIDHMLSEMRSREAIQYRRGGGKPTIIFAMDEAQNIVPQADRQRQLAQLGEMVGKLDVHLLIATQKPLEETLPGLMFNMSSRMVGHVPSSRDAALLTGRKSADAPAHDLTERGDFFLIQGGHVRRFTVCMATEEDVRQVPQDGHPHWPDAQPPRRDNVFEKEAVKADVGGRPRIEVEDPRIIARYMWGMAIGESITEPQARAAFGFARTGHVRHRKFAASITAELDLLRAAWEKRRAQA